MPKSCLKYFFLFLILSDTGYSFVQHLQMPMDGDLARIVLPAEEYQKVLTDPFGMRVLINDEVYSSPNRFFIHWLMSGYFKTVPILLQKITSPIESVYLSIAIIKILIQLFLIWLLAFFITGREKISSGAFFGAALLVTPLFQTSGYFHTMGIIEQSVTYTFFYALPVGILAFFFMPFFYASQWKWNPFFYLIWVLLALILPFSGPLVPAITLLVCFLSILFQITSVWERFTKMPFFKKLNAACGCIPRKQLFYFFLISFLSLYSLYIGRNNADNFSHTLPLFERYAKLPEGLFKLLFQKLGLPLILFIIIVNSVIIYTRKNNRFYFRLLKWFGIFTLFYVLLLPLGGFREYRPLVIRRDTFLPITLGLIFFLGYSTTIVVKILKGKYKQIHLTWIILILLVFSISDKPEWNKNDCEKNALEKLSIATGKAVLLNQDCPVMAWGKIKDVDYSEVNAKMLQYWGITDSIRLYYQR